MQSPVIERSSTLHQQGSCAACSSCCDTFDGASVLSTHTQPKIHPCSSHVHPSAAAPSAISILLSLKRKLLFDITVRLHSAWQSMGVCRQVLRMSGEPSGAPSSGYRPGQPGGEQYTTVRSISLVFMASCCVMCRCSCRPAHARLSQPALLQHSSFSQLS